MSIQNPVIVVPGITASRLTDQYPVSPETVWSVVRKHYDRVALHPDDLRYERIEPARVAPDKVFTIPYGELIEELRYNLTLRADKPTPVFPFAYDWRQPLSASENLLGEFVEEVIDRTKLLPHYHQNVEWMENPKVTLIGHSMGGLIITGYLSTPGGSSGRVAKVITLGTPYRGSFEAPLKVVTGLANLGTEDGASSRDREAARVTPGLYHLLPEFEGAITVPNGFPNSLFEADLWQPGVFNTFEEYVRLYGAKKRTASERKEFARQLFVGILAEAENYRQRIDDFSLATANLSEADWLCIVGVDAETRVHLSITKRGNKPYFNLESAARKNEYSFRLPKSSQNSLVDNEDSTLTGDGTVPYMGSKPAFLPTKRLVCVRPRDFGYWEIGDRLLLKKAGFHGLLPKMNLVHRLIVSYLQGRIAPDTRAIAAPDLGDDRWDPPIRGLKHKKR